MISIKHDRRAVQRVGVRLAIAGGLALAAAAATQSWLESAAAAARPGPAMLAVLVTAGPIDAGTTLTPAHLRWQPWPAAAIDRTWLVRGRQDIAAMVGRTTAARLAAGTPVTPAMATDAGTGLAAGIAPGRRAVTIAVTPAAGLAGFIAPGDRVDVLLTQAIGNRHTGQTLLSGITVLGVDQRQRGDTGLAAPLEAAGDAVADALEQGGAAPPDLVTLEVTPRQAEFLAVAGELGKLSLALRGANSRDGAAPATRRSWDTDITGLSAAMFASAPASNGAPALAAPALAAAPSAPATGSRSGGVEVVYGLPAAAASPAPAAPQ